MYTHIYTHTLPVVASGSLRIHVGHGGFAYCGGIVLPVDQIHHLAQKRAVLLLEGFLFLFSFDILYELFSGSLRSKDTCQRISYTNVCIYREHHTYTNVCIYKYIASHSHRLGTAPVSTPTCQ